MCSVKQSLICMCIGNLGNLTLMGDHSNRIIVCGHMKTRHAEKKTC